MTLIIHPHEYGWYNYRYLVLSHFMDIPQAGNQRLLFYFILFLNFMILKIWRNFSKVSKIS
jgi:hypothetical protein